MIGIIVFITCCYSINSQSISPYVVSTNGSIFSQTTFSLSWTLGQIASSSLFAVDNVLSQGFQQPYYYDPIDIPEHHQGVADIHIYPNPAKGFVNIEYSTAKKTRITIELLDLLGNRIRPETNKDSDIFPQVMRLPVDDIKSGIYLLRVISVRTNVFKIYKIVKI